jgi:hypothetical protein
LPCLKLKSDESMFATDLAKNPFSLNNFTNFFDRPRFWFWFSFSLVVPLYFGSISAYYALTKPYIVQDDARQHVVWFQQFSDPQLFPGDLIANYYQAADPIGYKFFYQTIANLGIEPLTAAKVLPIIFGLVTTIYLFKLSIRILPIPAGAFLTVLIFNQSFWLKDDVISATPRAFLYPLFAAFLYYLLKRSVIPCLIIIALQGLLFPQFMLVEIAVLTVHLLNWREKIPQSQQKQNYIFWLLGLFVALIVMIPFTLNISELGSIVTVDQMKNMPEYGWKGRSQYFGVAPLSFIFNGASGLRPPLRPPIIWFSIGLPFLLRSSLPLVRSITQEVKILLQVAIGSLGLFFLAHLLLLKLYFPSRYTYHSLRFVMAIAAGIVITILLNSGWQWFCKKLQDQAKFSFREKLILRFISLFIAISVIAPAVPYVFLSLQGWRVGKSPEIYQFLANQPQDILIASLTKETDNLPAFSQRSILVSEEFALPYHLTYYRQIEQRAIDLIHLQYSPDLAETKSLIQQYGIDFLLIEPDSFKSSYLLNKDWLVYSSFQSTVFKVINQLNQGVTPALAQLADQCLIISTEKLSLIDANCVIKAQT